MLSQKKIYKTSPYKINYDEKPESAQRINSFSGLKQRKDFRYKIGNFYDKQLNKGENNNIGFSSLSRREKYQPTKSMQRIFNYLFLLLCTDYIY